MLRRNRSGLALAFCAAAACACVLVHGLLFVAGSRLPPQRHVTVARGAVDIAPAPVKETLRPAIPSGIDDGRFRKEGVRWLMDEEQVEKPPAWHVLLLQESYEKPKNTLARVAASLAMVLGLAVAVAEAKAAHAKEHYFAVVHTAEKYGESVQAAQDLQSRGLVVRVVPAVKSSSEGESKDSTREPEKTPAAGDKA
eukprot:TRINITY_DN6175_c0_g1_i1.p2 TRINITY_DN6175_c0_g1~~TRINITY_DN6175_c0_g1_i1.p2  ORF type:complete len:220 (+),score=57.13 TRINITY_DN6175_c0_g1_i1:75-662(+)